MNEPATRSTLSDMYALLIGVDDYGAYGETASLQGSVNDVAAWSRVCAALRVKPENVHRLVTGPAAALEARFPGGWKVATRQNILDELAWLAGKLADGKSPGLLTYSGHGDVTPEGLLAICPTDVKLEAGAVQNLVTLEQVARQLEVGKAKDLLTVVLDCCHSGTGARPLSRVLSLRGETAEVKAARPTLGARVLTSCDAGQIAYQSEFTSQYHGAFTWALTASLLQWAAKEEAGAVRLDVTYGDACKVSQKLLGVLNYTNQTALLDPPSAESLMFFQPSATPEPGASRTPDARRNQVQLDPNIVPGGTTDGTLYTLTLSYLDQNQRNQTVQGQVLSVGNGNTTLGYRSDTEYWNLGSAFTSAWTDANATAKSLTFSPPTLFSWGSPAAPPAGWTGSTSSPSREADMASNWQGTTDEPPASTFWTGNVGLDVSLAGAPTWWYFGAVAPSDSYFVNRTNAPTTTFVHSAPLWQTLTR